MQYQPPYGLIWGRNSAQKLNFSLPSHFETHELLLHLNSDFFHKRLSALGSRKLMEWWDHPWSWIPECVTGELHLEGWMGGKGRITLLELVASVWNVYRVLKKEEFSKKKKRCWWYIGRHERDGYRESHNSCARNVLHLFMKHEHCPYLYGVMCGTWSLQAVELNVWNIKMEKRKKKERNIKRKKQIPVLLNLSFA